MWALHTKTSLRKEYTKSIDYSDVSIQNRFCSKPGWKNTVEQCWMNSSLWESQTTLSCRLHYLGCSCSSTWSQWWATWAWSSSPRWMPDSKHPCTSFSDTSLTDLGYSTTVGPKMLESFVVAQNTISYYFCALQLAFFLVFIISELFFCQQCPMTTMWPFFTLCSTLSSCHKGYVGSWWQSPISIAHLCLF